MVPNLALLPGHLRIYSTRRIGGSVRVDCNGRDSDVRAAAR